MRLINNLIHKEIEVEIEEIEWKLNNRPRKSPGYLTQLENCKKRFNFDFGSRCTSN